MENILKKSFKILVYAVLAVIALVASMLFGGSRFSGAHSSITGVTYTYADAPSTPVEGSGSAGEGCSCSGCEGSGGSEGGSSSSEGSEGGL